MKVSVIIPCAGSGNRFGELKQFKILNGEPLLYFALKPFLDLKEVLEIIIAVPKNKVDFVKNYNKKETHSNKKIKVVEGGTDRHKSILNCIKILDKKTKLICIHDAARPFITKKLIQKCLKKCKKYDGAILAIKSSDTVKYADDKLIKKTINREKVWLAQTPQVFHKNKLIKAIKRSSEANEKVTDESILMEKMGYSIRLVEGHMNNFKITFNSDWKFAEFLAKGFLKDGK